mmetsp:Transcript_10994/g.27052  ORF Transcript_10994/g.27052 Transcript_10994/m.27052 type:complete len:387 (-) Transcript_10994:2166-3326(-)
MVAPANDESPSRGRAPEREHRRHRRTMRRHLRHSQLRLSQKRHGRPPPPESPGVLPRGRGGRARRGAHGASQGTLRVLRMRRRRGRVADPGVLRRPSADVSRGRAISRGDARGGRAASAVSDARVHSRRGLGAQVQVSPSAGFERGVGAHPVVLRHGEQLHGGGTRHVRLSAGVPPQERSRVHLPEPERGGGQSGEVLELRRGPNPHRRQLRHRAPSSSGDDHRRHHDHPRNGNHDNYYHRRGHDHHRLPDASATTDELSQYCGSVLGDRDVREHRLSRNVLLAVGLLRDRSRLLRHLLPERPVRERTIAPRAHAPLRRRRSSDVQSSSASSHPRRLRLRRRSRRGFAPHRVRRQLADLSHGSAGRRVQSSGHRVRGQLYLESGQE